VAIDWEASVGAPCVAVFGEPARFTPASGAPAFDVTGVFDDEFRSSAIIVDGDPDTSDFLPVFGINASQFAPTTAFPTRVPPVQNDRIDFPAGAKWYSGKAFLVKEPRPDGHGIFHLALNETTP
jgi:hypothetical protein